MRIHFCKPIRLEIKLYELCIKLKSFRFFIMPCVIPIPVGMSMFNILCTLYYAIVYFVYRRVPMNILENEKHNTCYVKSVGRLYLFFFSERTQ